MNKERIVDDDSCLFVLILVMLEDLVEEDSYCLVSRAFNSCFNVLISISFLTNGIRSVICLAASNLCCR